MCVVGNEEIIWFLLFSLTPDGGEEPTDVDWKMVNRFFDHFCADLVTKSNWLEMKSFRITTENFEISQGKALVFEPNSKDVSKKNLTNFMLQDLK